MLLRLNTLSRPSPGRCGPDSRSWRRESIAVGTPAEIRLKMRRFYCPVMIVLQKSLKKVSLIVAFSRRQQCAGVVRIMSRPEAEQRQAASRCADVGAVFTNVLPHCRQRCIGRAPPVVCRSHETPQADRFCTCLCPRFCRERRAAPRARGRARPRSSGGERAEHAHHESGSGHSHAAEAGDFAGGGTHDHAGGAPSSDQGCCYAWCTSIAVIHAADWLLIAASHGEHFSAREAVPDCRFIRRDRSASQITSAP